MIWSKSQFAFGVAIFLATAGAMWQGAASTEEGEPDRSWVPEAAEGTRPLRLPSPGEALTVSGSAEPSVHAVSAVELSDGTLRAFWFGGSREGARDVSIYSATLPPGSDIWSAPEIAIRREDVEQQTNRIIRKLGNPVAAFDSEGKLWLFVVSVSMGGWSASALNVTHSTDEGKTWSDIDRLVISPFANISTLAKAPPILNRDGSFLLPVYHEMINKFSQAVRVNTTPMDENRIEARITFPHSQKSIQPWIVPVSESQGVAFFRSTNSESQIVHRSESYDAGATWSPPQPTTLPNPNAAVAACRLNGDEILLAYNHSTKNRDNLTLAVTQDWGTTWNEIGAVETKKRLAGEAEFRKVEYSYPWLLKSRSGEVHLLYTWNRTEIRHLRLTSGEEAKP